MMKKRKIDSGSEENPRKQARQNDEGAQANDPEVERVLKQTILDILRSRKHPGSTC